METAIIESLNLKKFCGEIKVTPGTPAADFYERYCRLAKQYNEEQLEAFSNVILGIDPKR